MPRSGRVQSRIVGNPLWEAKNFFGKFLKIRKINRLIILYKITLHAIIVRNVLQNLINF